MTKQHKKSKLKAWQEAALSLDVNTDFSRRTIAKALGISRSTCLDFLREYEGERGKFLASKSPDEELLELNVKLAQSVQKQQDLNRIKNKTFREQARVVNAVSGFESSLTEVFKKNSLSPLTVRHTPSGDEVVGIVQISDTHFNEEVNLEVNKYNFTVASKRIRKLINKAKSLFKAFNVTNVLVAFTGDLLNSDRRLDELLENSTNRSKAVFLAVDILQQAILDLNKDYNITVASICGNEARVNPEMGWIDQIASDNYDYTIHQTLSYLFRGSDSVTFLPIDNPLEKVVSVCGKHILLTHGHNGIATNNNIEGGVSKTISRYAVAGVTLDYVLLGHIHTSNISDFYARSSGLPGANAYSEKALNFYSKAAQNLFIVSSQGIDGFKVDLQEVINEEPYTFDSTLEAYNSKSSKKSLQGAVVIHQVVV